MYVALHPLHVNLYTRSEHNPNGVGDLLQNTFWILYVCDIIFKLNLSKLFVLCLNFVTRDFISVIIRDNITPMKT